MWRALLILAFVGCGAVSEEGSVDVEGCPTRIADVSGTATTTDTCPCAPSTVQIVDGAYNGQSIDHGPGTTSIVYDQALDMCSTSFGLSLDCGCDAGYHVLTPPKR